MIALTATTLTGLLFGRERDRHNEILHTVRPSYGGRRPLLQPLRLPRIGRKPSSGQNTLSPREPACLLCCELAYTGTLFWLPLLVFPGSKEARYHANQGLWLLILSVAGCTSIRLLGFIDNL